MSRTEEISKLDIRPEDRTPLVEQLLCIIAHQNKRIEALEAEILRLKGLPEKPRYGQSSTLEDPQGKPSAAGRGRKRKKKKTRGKRPGSEKRAKTAELVIHDTVLLATAGLPEGTVRLGFEDYYVQDLRIEAYNTCYRRTRYRTPDGELVIAPLPENIRSHFGSGLQSYLLYQHFHNQVTQPLLHEELTELIPLHNNPSENDIRQFVKKRKISAGTRSDLGRRCRDTFLSLKTTCRKLGVSFLKFLQDRINGLGEIAPLPQLIEEQATAI